MGAKDLLSHSVRIAWKDLTELWRNRLGMVLLIVMPLFMMAMIGFIYPSSTTTISKMPVALVNQDQGFYNTTSGTNSTIPSQIFIGYLEGINNQAHMLILSKASTIADVKNKVQSGEIDGAILIPSDFSSSIISGEQGNLTIITDQSNPTIAATLQAALSATFDQIGTAIAEGNVQNLNATVPANNYLAFVKPYTIQTEGVVSGNPSYFNFIAPGIMAMTVMMSVMTGLPVAISKEKEDGTMDGMMVAPIDRLSVILGKALGQTARGLLQGFIIMGLAVGLFAVIIHGSILLVVGLLLLGVFSFVGLGIVLTSFAKDQETAQMMMMTLMFPMMFLSGVLFPISQMPWYMQDISKFLPLTYASDALRKVMVLGAGIPDISTDLLIMIAFGVIMIAIAVPLFQRMMTK
jgi:ABC-2 type transport system permease protein